VVALIGVVEAVVGGAAEVGGSGSGRAAPDVGDGRTGEAGGTTAAEGTVMGPADVGDANPGDVTTMDEDNADPDEDNADPDDAVGPATASPLRPAVQPLTTISSRTAMADTARCG
jgi:hypothetical protein